MAIPTPRPSFGWTGDLFGAGGHLKQISQIIALVAVITVLAGCGSTQERRDSFYQKAREAISAGNTGDAQVALKNALKIDPQFAKGYALMADLHIGERSFANAFANYSRAVELDPELIDAQLGLCKLYFLQRSMDKVEEKADFILARQPKHIEAGVLKAIAQMKNGDADGALFRLVALENENPDNVDIILAKSEVYASRGQRKEAEQAIQAGIVKNPGSELLHLHIAKLLIEDNRLDDAEQHYRQIIAADENNPRGHMLLVNFYGSSGQMAKAKNLLGELAKRFPKEEAFRLGQANAASRFGTSTEVEIILEQAHKDFPDSNSVRLTLAEHYARTMQSAKAELLLQEFIKANPDLPQALKARKILASAYLSNQEGDKAQSELEAVLKRNPRDLEGHFLKGSLDLQRGRVREAILELRQVVDEDPKSVKAYEMLVRSHLLNNEGYQAESLMQKALKESPESTPMRMLYVETLVAVGKVDKAIGELSAMAEKDKNNPAVHLTLGDLQAQKKNYAAAKASYTRAAAEAPREPIPHVRLGALAWLQQDVRGANEEYDKALALFPDLQDALEAKVGLLLGEKRTDDALKFVNQRLAANPKNAYLTMLVGRIHLTANDTTKAEQSFEEAVRLSPDSSAAYQLLGQTKLRQGKIKEGIAKFREAYTANPNSPAVGLALGVLLQMHENPDEARKIYEDILKKKPDYVPAMNNLAYLYAQDLPTSENLKKAQALVDRLRKVDSGEILDTVGWVQFKAGNVEDGLTTTLRAWDKKKGLPTVAYHLGAMYQAKNDLPKAIKWYEKALGDNTPFAERDIAKSELAKLKKK